VPFVNKVPQRTAEQDAQEAERNRNWDPNAPLAGKNPARPQPAASDVVLPTPEEAAASAAAAQAAQPAPRAARDPAAILAGKNPDGARPAASQPTAAAAPSTPPSGVAVQFFVQAGAYSTPEDAETQRAKVALLGLTAKVLAREQAGRTVYRVRVGPYDNRQGAERVQDTLAGSGVDATLVRIER